MRCAECGHSLATIASGAPCPECGVVTPDEARNPPPPVNKLSFVLRFGWPMIAAIALAILGVALASARSDALGTVVLVLVLVTVVVATPVNSAVQASILMRRLPRRTRLAPLLFAVPRAYAVPALAAVASLVGVAILAGGACVIGMSR